MVKHQNLLAIVTVIFLAIAILVARSQKHSFIQTKRYAATSVADSVTIAYGSYINDGANLLDLYLPDRSYFFSGLNKETYPLIVYIHGGAWQAGDKSIMPDASEFTKHGYIVASLNYRLSNVAHHPAQIEDCKTAINWLHSHAQVFKIDPNRIGIWGISAGGHLAALLGTTCNTRMPEWGKQANELCRVQAICDWCGPTDLMTIHEQSGSQCDLDRAVTTFLGAAPKDKPELAKNASPITYVREGLPPFLIMHGDKDTVVPPEQSRELFKALRAVHNNVTLKIIPNGQHQFGDQDSLKTVYNFFDKALKKRN